MAWRGDEVKMLKDMTTEELWQLFPIVLKEHNSAYAVWYSDEEARLLNILRDYDVCRISHIGSTAVDGLVAKPTIDILLELPETYNFDAVFSALENDGWLVMAKDDSDKTIDLNKGYTPNGFAEKVFHLHIKPYGDWNELYFRDYLREHSGVARQYEMLKLSLKEKYEYNRDAYTEAKTDFIVAQTQKAREEFGGLYLPRKSM